MRIGIDARLWQETGVGRYIRNLIKQIAVLDEKNEYTLFVRPEDTSEIEKIVTDKFVLISTDIKWHTVQEQVKLPFLINNARLDLMHFPYFSLPVMYGPL